MNRERKKDAPEYPPRHITLSDINLPESLQQTIANETGQKTFVYHDSGPADPELFVLLATTDNVKLLKADIFADGTFDCAPDLFAQVLIFWLGFI